jgi:hypothetical protein
MSTEPMTEAERAALAAIRPHLRPKHDSDGDPYMEWPSWSENAIARVAVAAVRPILAAEALAPIRERHRPHRNTGRDLSKPSIWCEGHEYEEWFTIWPCEDASLVYTETEIEEADRG